MLTLLLTLSVNKPLVSQCRVNVNLRQYVSLLVHRIHNGQKVRLQVSLELKLDDVKGTWNAKVIFC